MRSLTRPATLAQFVFGSVLAGMCLLATAAKATPVGNPALQFNVWDQHGDGVGLTDFQGRGVILDFCAVWCTPCQDFYTTVYPSIAGRDLILPVLMQNPDGSASTQSYASAWSSAFGLATVAHLAGDESQAALLESSYLLGLTPDPGVATFPTFVFIDADLSVAANIQGVPSLDDPRWTAAVRQIHASRNSVPEPGFLWLGALAWLVYRLPRQRRRSLEN